MHQSQAVTRGIDHSTAGGQADVDASVAGQITWHLRDSVCSEVARRPCGGHAQAWADGQGNHVLVDGFAKSNTGVEAVGNDVTQCIADVELDADVRIAMQ
ncbi:hypothetical protein G6F54_013778 [Rhizopus delemar]|nr:hypothetical protein G6F54_013778 [Rhizopus delemar]